MSAVSPETNWTIQSDYSYEPADGIPGQVVTKAELPDPEVQREAGIDPEVANAGLVVVDSAKEQFAVRTGQTVDEVSDVARKGLDDKSVNESRDVTSLNDPAPNNTTPENPPVEAEPTVDVNDETPVDAPEEPAEAPRRSKRTSAKSDAAA